MSRLGRRSFLHAFVAAAAGTPLLPAFDATSAEPSRKRFIVFATPNGTAMNITLDAFWPASLDELSHIVEPMAPFREQLTVMRGVDMKSAYRDPIPPNHDPDHLNMLTARQPHHEENVGASFSGESIDWVIGRDLVDVQGVQTPYPVVNLGVFTGTGYAQHISSRGDRQPNAAMSDPVALWNTLFAEIDIDPAQLEALRVQRRSVLDSVNGDLSALEQELGCDDRVRLQAHLQAVRDLEHRIDNLGGACEQPAMPAAEMSLREHDRFPDVGRVQLDLLVAMLACDLTRVVTLQWDGGASDLRHHWADPTITRGQHSIAHDGMGDSEPTRQQWLANIDRWYCEQLAYLCERMSTTMDIDGMPLLDHSAILWAHEQSQAGYHGRRDMPYVLVGGCEGALAQGQRLDFGGRYNPDIQLHIEGKAHGGLLCAIGRAMGMPLESFGDPDYWEGNFDELLA